MGEGEGEASGVGLGDDSAAAGETSETAGAVLHQREVTAAIAITAISAIATISAMRRPPANQRRAGPGSKTSKREIFEGGAATAAEFAACTRRKVATSISK